MLLLTSVVLSAQVTLTSTNLPILIIETENGQSIPDEPKRNAELRIVYNGPGELNRPTDEVYDYQGRIGIELRGQTSQNFDKKPYGFETRDAMGENNNVELLGMPAENDWVLHNPFSDKSLIRNAVTYILAGRIMEYAPRVRMVEVMVNGEYMGVYLLTEKIKRDKNRVAVSKLTPESEDITGGYIMKFDKGNEVAFTSDYRPPTGNGQETRFLYHYPDIDDITNEQAAYIKNFIDEMEDVLASDNFTDPETGYRQYLDPETFMDFLFINELTRNVDGYRLSSYFYKDRDSKGGRLKMGPVWDFNLALGNANYCEGGKFTGWGYSFNSFCPQDFWVIHFWWNRLLSDPNFKTDMTERWNRYRSGPLSDESVLGVIDSLTNLLTSEGAADRNFRRWPVLDQYVWPNAFVGGSYDAEIEYLTSWTRSRMSWLDQAFNTATSIPPNGQTNQLTTYPNPVQQDGELVFQYTFNSRFITTVKLYNSLGQFVAELTENEVELRNENKFTWRQLPAAGIYYYNVVSLNGVEFAGKIVITD